MKGVLAGLVLALALALAGCGGGGKTTSTGGGLSASGVAQRTATRTAKLKGFHFAYRVTDPPSGSGLDLSSADGDVDVALGKLRANVSGTYSGISLSSQVILAGGKAYLKNPLSGAWQSFDTKASPVGYFDPAKGVFAVIRKARGLQLDGSETVDGTDCYRLHGTLPASDVASFLVTKPGQKRVTVDLDVGKQDFLLRQVRIAGPVNASEPKDISRTITLSHFDVQVIISAPKTG